MARLLTEAELIDLTGYQAPGKQLESLRKLGLHPLVRPDGRPRVTDDAVTQAMLGNIGTGSVPASESAPNWTALKRRA